jgi:hypothetical protein
MSLLVEAGRPGGGPRLRRRLSADHTDHALELGAYILIGAMQAHFSNF